MRFALVYILFFYINPLLVLLQIWSEITMSIMSSFFRSRSRSSNSSSNNNIFDFDPLLFPDEIWDPIMFHDFPFPNSSPLSRPGFSSTENTSSTTARFGKTRADWRETPEAHVFKIDLPGVKKDEVKVQVEEEKILQISGERHREKEEKNDKWHHAERSSSKFMRKFRLPENAKVDQVKATMENGVLTVSVPKQQSLTNNKPYIRVIEISG